MAWKKVTGEHNSDALLRYFTKTGCAVTANGDDDELICPQPFKAGEFTLEDGPDAAAQVQPPLASGDGADEPEEPDDDIDEDVYDGIIDGLAYNPDIHSHRIALDDGVENVGNLHEECDEEVYCLLEALEPGREGGKYKYEPFPTDGAKDVQNGDIIVTLFSTGWERGKVEDMKKASPSQKREAKDFSVPRLVLYVLDSSYWLHDLNDDNASYLSKEQFKKLKSGASVEADEGVQVGSWCIVRHVPSEFDDSDDSDDGNDDGGDDDSE